MTKLGYALMAIAVLDFILIHVALIKFVFGG